MLAQLLTSLDFQSGLFDLYLQGMTLCYTVTWLYGVPLWHNHVTIMGQQYTIANILETFLYGKFYILG